MLLLTALAALERTVLERERYAIQLRKKSTADFIRTKRALLSNNFPESSETPHSLKFLNPPADFQAQLHEAVQILSNPVSNESFLFDLVLFVRKATAKDEAVGWIVGMGACSLIVKLLGNCSARVCAEVLWTLNNVAASPSHHCNLLRALEVPKRLGELLESKGTSTEIKELVRLAILVVRLDLGKYSWRLAGCSRRTDRSQNHPQTHQRPNA